MYLHIGHGQLVAYKEIVALLSIALLDHSSAFRQTFYRLWSERQVVGALTDAKTVIVADRLWYLSPIAPLTLAHRWQRRDVLVSSDHD
jgi:hypothetical protein